jgi:uncharacterized protein YceK
MQNLIIVLAILSLGGCAAGNDLTFEKIVIQL